MQDADYRHWALLSARRERHYRCAAQSSDEIAPLHTRP
jgi:hypothetical protein